MAALTNATPRLVCRAVDSSHAASERYWGRLTKGEIKYAKDAGASGFDAGFIDGRLISGVLTTTGFAEPRGGEVELCSGQKNLLEKPPCDHF
jgi:hypothetical protein